MQRHVPGYRCLFQEIGLCADCQKEVFNGILANAIQNVPVNDRVILDTGDGAAVTFLGDVEDALKAVLVFRESLLGEGAAWILRYKYAWASISDPFGWFRISMAAPTLSAMAST
ncbi:MAG: hypothetical protein WDM70_11550 [Nitrosomonadales bacterium]